jgi:protein-tyrosine phosphatase
VDVLVVCTANRCRSPMAQLLLERQFASVGELISVGSAGLLESGQPAVEGASRALARRGLDLSSHSSEHLTAEMIEDASLVLGMERAHVREVVVLVPGAWSRTFTVKELVRRGEQAGPRRPDETVEAWLALVHAGRSPQDMLGGDDLDDIADPIGGSLSDFERTALELDESFRRLADLLVVAPAAAGVSSSQAPR